MSSAAEFILCLHEDTSKTYACFINLPLNNVSERLVLTLQNFCTASMQGVEICLERPWRRETMHNLVKEATAIDFNDLGDDLEVAKDVTLRTLGSGLEGKDKSAIAACPSVGHLVNEVNMLLVSSFNYTRNLFFQPFSS